jgi:hypothetical protein
MHQDDNRLGIQAKPSPQQTDFTATAPPRPPLQPNKHLMRQSGDHIPAMLIAPLWGIGIGAVVFVGMFLLCETGIDSSDAVYKMCVQQEWRFVAFLFLSALIALPFGITIDCWRKGSSPPWR